MPATSTSPDIPVDVERLLHYRRNPLDFFVDVLAVDRDFIWSAMREMVDAILENRFVAVAGCHNSSKTFTAACVAWWWVLCWPDSLVYVTAAKEDQIKGTFWTQLRERYEAAPQPLGGELLSLDWKVGDVSRIHGATAKVDTGSGGATGMQGWKSQRLLMIFDEATAIDRQVWESAHGVVTFPENRWLAMANPTNPNCGFRDCFRPTSGWKAIQFDALRNPNLEGAKIDRDTRRVVGGKRVHPYLADAEWVEDKLRLWGEGSPAWEARVRGRFPSAAIDTLISLDDFATALDRAPSPTMAREVRIGADVAAQGDDYSVITVLRDDELVHCEWFHEPDTTKTEDRIVQVAKDYGLTEARAHQVALDAGGLGKPMVDGIRRRHGWGVVGVNFGDAARDPERFADRRTELWAEVRDWLRTTGSLKNARPDWTQNLEADLCGCVVDNAYPKGGHIVSKLERKKDMKKRLGHSPDHGDALAIALSYRSRPDRLLEPGDWTARAEPGGTRSQDLIRERHAQDRRGAEEKAGFYDDAERDSFYD